MKAIRNLLIGIAFAGALIIGWHLLQAQDATTTGLNSLTAQDLGSMSDMEVLLKAMELIPPSPASSAPRAGTFWSAQHAPGTRQEWPPLPGDPLQVPIWNLGDNVFLLDDLKVDYSAPTRSTQLSSMAKLDGIPSPGGGSGDGGGNPLDFTNPPPDYGTNLYIAQLIQGAGSLSGIVSNSAADILYEIQSKTDLVAQANWSSEGFIYGSELTNWTPLSVAQIGRPILFLRIRSWQDSNGTGIPDWWWLLYFGQITNVNANASAAGDGFSNLQKFQMGLNPTNYYNPNPVAGFFGCLDITGTNVILEWSNAPGPVVGYAIQRGTYNPSTYTYSFVPIAQVSSNATCFKDAGANTNNAAQNDAYKLAAVYPGGSATPTNTWYWSQGGPTPGNVYAYADAKGTNVLLSWTPAPGPATNYWIEHGVYNASNGAYIFTPVTQVGVNATNYQATGALTNASNWSDQYGVAAVFPGGGLSQVVAGNSFQSSIGASAVNVGSENGPTGPGNFYGYSDSTGTNLFLNWNAVTGNVTNHLVYGANFNYGVFYYVYGPLGKVNAGTTNFEVAGNPYNRYAVVAAYADGSLSQAALWNAGASGPGALAAYLDWTGTNIMLAWSPVAGATGYIIDRSDYYGNSYYQIGSVGSSVNVFEDVGGNNDSYGLGAIMYQVQATYPNGGISPAVTTTVATIPPAPGNLSVTVNGANAVLTWPPVVTPGISYTIERGIYNPATGTYSYSQLGQTSATTFTDTGAITGNNSYNNVYEVIANYPGGQSSLAGQIAVNETAAPPGQNSPANNLTLGVQLVRNQTGRWQLMFSGLSTNVQTIALNWYSWDYFYDIGPFANPELGYPFNVQTPIAVSSLTNGVYVIPDYLTTNAIANGIYDTTVSGWDFNIGPVVMVQPMASDGTYGPQVMAGFLSGDEPAFADGRQHLWQNLLFELRAASISQCNASLGLPTDTNYVESSIFPWAWMDKGYNSLYVDYLAKDDLWPFTANYQLHQQLSDPNYNGPSSFVWSNNLVTIPAPAVLGIGDPYWILQNAGNLADVGITAASNPANSVLTQQNGVYNLFGLEFGTARLTSAVSSGSGLPDSGPWLLPPGTPVTIDPNGAYNLGGLYSQTADPSLSLVNYYFAPINTPGMAAPNENPLTEEYPVPDLAGFANTNQTGLMIASVGAPAVIGGWGRFSIQNSSKLAYLGQYFQTNAYMVDANGNITTNTTGVVSPYGDFFPTQPGTVAMTTMPDYNNDSQGTGIVRVIGLDVDANHDGTMDFSYTGPDQTSPSRPFRFWANDDSDAFDDYGTGIPGVQPFYLQDGFAAAGDYYVPNPVTGFPWQPFYRVHGRRDLVDFFPVYINIGSLFQSNALSAGISITDTNWQFVLSQADGVLRFVYTDLTPTNYMNFLLDTNESGNLADAVAWPVNNINYNPIALSQSFIAGIATNNQGIILVEAATNTTQPLVLTIYHGTNQIAQTQLYLSISGVEQMFRSKTMMLNPEPGTVADRLTDASVPNEPDTIDKNLVFVHGYNVNPDQARGWDADIFKRLYWSGSHAKFYGVTWEAADSQVANAVTIDLQTNIVNAFNTAPLLNTFLNSLSGTNIVAAHSLGNMLVLSTLNDYNNQSINTYFMIDAAVAIEAIDKTAGSNPDMYPSAWTNYNGNLWASDWYGLFPTNDYRSSLTWWGRLANFQNAAVYNFYSSGEEVLRDYSSDPPTSLLGIATGQLVSLWEGDTGEYTWAWQEKLKGLMPANFLLSSDHGGWQFSTNYASLTIAQANALQSSQLKTNAFFNFGSPSGSFFPFNGDLALESSGGNAYAQTNRNRILSDAIPALTLPIGANSVGRLAPSGQPDRNFDMQGNYENGWPLDRPPRTVGVSAAGEWHHSDVRAVAYTFTYPLFNQMVTLGNLK